MNGVIEQTDDCILEELTELAKTYPQIKEKAIVDFVNSLDVIDDIVRVQEKTNSGLGSRFFSAINGTSARRQAMINGNVSDNLRFIKNYIQDNETKRQDSDLLLQQVSAGVGKLADKLYSVVKTQISQQNQIDDIYKELRIIEDISNCQFHELEQRLNTHEAYILAKTEMDNALSVWKVGKYKFTPEQALWMVCSRLNWGHFGTWLRLTQQQPTFQQQAQDMLNTLRNECIVILRDQTKRSDNQLLSQETLISRITAQDMALRNTLSFLSDQNSTPLLRTLHQSNTDEYVGELSKHLPYVFSNIGLVDSMVNTLSGAR